MSSSFESGFERSAWRERLREYTFKRKAAVEVQVREEKGPAKLRSESGQGQRKYKFEGRFGRGVVILCGIPPRLKHNSKVKSGVRV
jgi:hypothetical protein